MKKLLIALVILAGCVNPPPLRYQGPPIKPVPFPGTWHAIVVFKACSIATPGCGVFQSFFYSAQRGYLVAEMGPLTDIVPGEYLYCRAPATPQDCND